MHYDLIEPSPSLPPRDGSYVIYGGLGDAPGGSWGHVGEASFKGDNDLLF